ncbi:unnamed protein product [Cylindrotheca closterium]|uniref:G-protein coupled receptors family 1 profile domain-containing protein n=1 Tax=Cylindrotheca closterium TaxID=2856 RepID=A0AAD2FGQ9_9STRA|nr:unnamed protein product [Cylindrotheca closterium]
MTDNNNNNVLWDDFMLVDDFFDDDDDLPFQKANNSNGNGNESSQEDLPLTPSSLSPNQERALSILLLISAMLSALGSASIVYKVLRDKRQLSKPYHRTMLALSISDVIASLTFGLYPFLMPSETRIWSFGNHTSCNTLGFFTQFSFGAIGYNCILSFYYLLAIKFNIKRQTFSQRYERPMHFLNLSFFLITASVGAGYQFYGPVDVGMGCWVNNWPDGCHLTGDCVSQKIAIVFAGIPVSFFFVAIVVNNLVVYRHTRTIFNSLEKVYSLQEQQQKQKQEESSYTTSASSQQPQGSLTAKEAIAARKIQVRSEMYEGRLQEVALQASMYVGSFLVCYTPALSTRLIETFSYQYDDAKIYWLLVITAMTLPLQGFFNMFIYNRPHYVRVRKARPDMPMVKAICCSVVECKSFSAAVFPERTKSSATGDNKGPHDKKAKPRFSAVGRGSLDVVIEEESQVSDEHENDGNDCSEKPTDATPRLDNTTTDNDSTISHADDNDEGGEDTSSNDAPILHSPKGTAPAAVIDMTGTVSNSRQFGASGEIGFQQVNE